VAVDLRLPGMGGVGFLERAHALHPTASRALLLAMEPRGTRIPFDVLPTCSGRPPWGRSTSRSWRGG
jgi:hypothetical protein